MPPKPPKLLLSFRIPARLRDEAREVAEACEETLTDAVIEGLRLYIRDRRKRMNSPSPRGPSGD